MQKVKDALAKSYQHDKVTFWTEMWGVAFTMIAASILALQADNPNMMLIYPFYQIGSLLLLYTYFKRDMVWSVVLTIFYVAINTIGLIVVFLK